MIGLIPLPYKLGAAAALVALLAAGHLYRVKQADSAGFDRAVALRQVQDAAAVMERAHANAALEAMQAATNTTITKGKNDEIAKLRTRLAAAERMRQPAFCYQPASTTEAESTGSGHVTDPGGRLLPQRVEQDIQALILKTEEATATARACQAFIRENGLAP